VDVVAEVVQRGVDQVGIVHQRLDVSHKAQLFFFGEGL
jgi:hypothetical protein